MADSISFLLVFLWIAYFAIHSILVKPSVKALISKALALSPKQFRFLYVSISIMGLLGIAIYYTSLKSALLFEPSSVTKFISLVFATWGLITVKLSFKNYRLKRFLGLEEETEDGFRSEGILKLVRHPMYSGVILFMIGFFLFDPNWNALMTLIVFLIYIQIGIKLEEEKLVARFGKKYLDYKKETPMLIPEFWK